MAELAQHHTAWNEYIINGVLNDETVLNAAVNSDRENTVIEIKTTLNRLHLAISENILNSATRQNKGDLVNELDTYFTKERKPPLEQQLFDIVVRSDAFKTMSAEKRAVEHEPPDPGGGSAALMTTAPTNINLGNTAIIAAISTSSVTIDEVDSILRDGGNEKNSVLRIAAFMAKNKTPEENAAFLRQEYLCGHWGRNEEPGGKGYQFGTQPTAVWFDGSGITVGRGNSALFARDYALITWEQAAERVKALYDAGQFVSHDVLEEALHNESKERADDVIEVYNNISRGISDIKWELKKAMTKEQKEAVENDWKDRRYLIRGLAELENAAEELLNREEKASPDEIMQFHNELISRTEEIPEEWAFNGSHPETEEQITELIRDKGTISETDISRGVGHQEFSEYGLILRRLSEDVAVLKEMPDTPIRFWRSPYRTLERLEIAGLPNHGFPVTEYEPLQYMRFITDDEIDAYLSRGSNVSESKMRFLSHFLNEHTPKENEKFVKDEYGHGGGTWIGGGRSSNEPGKGMTLQRPGCDDVNWKYNKVVKRIREIVDSGRFMTRAELDRIPDYETIILARMIDNFYYNLEEYTSPFKDLELHYPKDDDWQAVRSFLNDTEQVQRILGEMEYIYVNTMEEDRFYEMRKAGFENLSAYHEGTYTLFPGLDKLPDPELAVTRRGRSSPVFTTPSEATQQLTLFDLAKPELIAENPLPVLPSTEEQQAVIEQKNEPSAEVNAPADLLSENDAFILDFLRN